MCDVGNPEMSTLRLCRVTSPPEYAVHYVEGLFYMPDCFFVNDHRQTYSELLDDNVTPQEKASRLAYGSLSPGERG